MPTPEIRIRAANALPEAAAREFVLYWMIAQRRTTRNFGLQRAAERARALKKPLLVLEALRCDYPWANDRLHSFVLDGMRANRERCEKKGVAYLPYVEARKGEGKRLLQSLAARACLVVTDEFPCFFLPRMIDAAASRLDVRLEAVDGNGLLPLRESEKEFTTAYSFRRFLQKHLLPHLLDPPERDPLRGLRPMDLPVDGEIPDDLSGIEIDHGVPPVAMRGGEDAARKRWRTFLGQGLAVYDEKRNEPDAERTSGLSPYLHFGHLSVHEIFADLARKEDWSPDRAASRADGKRAGWWGMSSAAEGWLDQLVTWRELGYHFCHHRQDYDRYDSLPDWALRTLEKHAGDPRTPTYPLSSLDQAKTGDPLWNAAQSQLRTEGTIHNYLRMLWGKKILEWARSPEEALRIMIDLNNRYALDGRNPNSYSGIFWILGRFDRAWGPQRPIFGTVRYMSSANTARKFRVKSYMSKYLHGHNIV